MKNESLQILGAILIVSGTALLLTIINKKRKQALTQKLTSYSHVPGFIEHQLNSTHQKA